MASRKTKSECKSGYTVTLSDFWPSRDSQVKKSKTESILDSKMPLSQLSQLPVTSSSPLSVSVEKDQQPPNPSQLSQLPVTSSSPLSISLEKDQQPPNPSQLSQLPVTSSSPLSVSLQKAQQPPNPTCLKDSHTSHAKHKSRRFCSFWLSDPMFQSWLMFDGSKMRCKLCLMSKKQNNFTTGCSDMQRSALS